MPWVPRSPQETAIRREGWEQQDLTQVEALLRDTLEKLQAYRSNPTDETFTPFQSAEFDLEEAQTAVSMRVMRRAHELRETRRSQNR